MPIPIPIPVPDSDLYYFLVNYINYSDYQLTASRPSIILVVVLGLTGFLVLLNGLWFIHGVCNCRKGEKMPWGWHHLFDIFMIACMMVGYASQIKAEQALNWTYNDVVPQIREIRGNYYPTSA